MSLGLYPPMAKSPVTYLAEPINESATTIIVDDISKLPDPPNIATIGDREDSETIKYGGKTGNSLTSVTRGFEGDAKEWSAGTPIANVPCAQHIRALQEKYEAHVDNTTDAHGIDDHFDATAADDVHGLLSGGFIIEESGSNDNGSYVRWSNGLQVCWIPSITLTYVNASTLRARWDFPAEFKSGSTPAGFANPNEYASQVSARTAGTVVNCVASYCNVVASAATSVFGEDDTWKFQVVAIGWWK